MKLTKEDVDGVIRKSVRAQSGHLTLNGDIVLEIRIVLMIHGRKWFRKGRIHEWN